MKSDPSCPRCGRAVQPPGLWTSAWQCDAHGSVAPLQPLHAPSSEALAVLLSVCRVPVWVPWPLPSGWVVTGFAHAGDDRSGGVACAVALSGPAPLGGIGELAVVAEDPGLGLASRLADLDGPDPGARFGSSTVDGKVRYEGHEIALWSVDAGEGCAAYVGEAMGSWLWFVLSPADVGMLMCEVTGVRDLRDGGAELAPPFGAMSPFLTARLAPRPV